MRAAATLLVLLAVAGGWSASPAVAAPERDREVRVRAEFPASDSLVERVRVKGSVRGVARRRMARLSVVLQQRLGGGWLGRRSVHPDRRGRFRLRWRPAAPGAVRVRVLARSKRRVLAKTRTHTVRIRPRAAVPALPPAPPPPEPAPPAPPGPPAPDPPLSCLNPDPSAPDIGVSVRNDLPPETSGLVLPGTRLRSNEPPHGADYVHAQADETRYPAGWTGPITPRWAQLDGVPPSRIVRVGDVPAFNGDGAAYRVAHDQSYYGLSPISVGDVNGDGIEDLGQSDHWSAVDGEPIAGEAHVYFGRPGGIDPRRDVPDLIFYGDRPRSRFGIEIAPAGDFDGDGIDDFMISAAFRPVRLPDGSEQPQAGSAWVVYGGHLNGFRCPTKVRAQDIGTKVPGFRLDGGVAGTHFLGWSNVLDSGDFDGDGFSDLVLGTYDLWKHPTFEPFRARAYVLYGGSDVPRSGAFHLGASDALDETIIEMPEPGWTQGGTLFHTSFVGDLDRDGHDELAIVAGRAYGDQGAVFVFRGRPGGLARGVVSPETADLVVRSDKSEDGRYVMRNLAGARPAGDVDGDGYPDVQVSARYARVDGRIVGAVGVLPGGRGITGTRRFLELEGILVGSAPEVLSIGMPGMTRGADLDGDGYSDLLVNDPYWREDYGGERQWRGRLWVVRGGPDLPPLRTVEEAAALHVLPDMRLPGLLGFEWGTGDFDGDGRPDIVIGDHYLGDAARHDRPGGSYLLHNGRDFRLP